MHENSRDCFVPLVGGNVCGWNGGLCDRHSHYRLTPVQRSVREGSRTRRVGPLLGSDGPVRDAGRVELGRVPMHEVHHRVRKEFNTPFLRLHFAAFTPPFRR